MPLLTLGTLAATTATAAGGTAGAAGAGAAAAGAASAGAAGVTAGAGAGAGVGAAGILSAGVGAAGVGVQYMGQKQAAEASEKAESLRKKQLQTDYARQTRKNIQEAIALRMQVQNAQAQQSGTQLISGVGGGTGNITQRAAGNQKYLDTSAQIGAGIFDANADKAAGLSLASTGVGLQNLASSFTQLYASPLFS